MKKILVMLAVGAIAFTSLAREDYIIEVEFYQCSFTLSIKQHIKDACNSFTFSFPTTKEFYESVHEGQELTSKFKTATFFLSGNIGSRKVRVKRKYVKKTEVSKTP